MYITNVNSCVITVLSLESVSISGDGRIFQTYGDSGVEYSYDFYLKDHLGSTRMVINSQDQITEAVAYQAYGAMDPLDSIANAPEIPAREKFTGKEFDTEGEDSANGVAGIQAYHFGARVYDPEVGVWLSVDPAEQDFFVYGYCNGNPIIFVDPNGENWIGAIIGAAIGGTIGGIAAYNASDGHAGATMAGILVGGVWGGALGSMAGSGISGAAGAGGAATAGSAGAGTGIGAAGASLLRAGTVAGNLLYTMGSNSGFSTNPAISSIKRMPNNYYRKLSLNYYNLNRAGIGDCWNYCMSMGTGLVAPYDGYSRMNALWMPYTDHLELGSIQMPSLNSGKYIVTYPYTPQYYEHVKRLFQRQQHIPTGHSVFWDSDIDLVLDKGITEIKYQFGFKKFNTNNLKLTFQSSNMYNMPIFYKFK